MRLVGGSAALVLGALLALPGSLAATDGIGLHLDQSTSPCRDFVVVDTLDGYRSDGRAAELGGGSNVRVALTKIFDIYLTGLRAYEEAIDASDWVDDRICMREARARELNSIIDLIQRGYGQMPRRRHIVTGMLRNEARALRGEEWSGVGLYEAIYGIPARDRSEDWRYDVSYDLLSEREQQSLEELDRLEREARLAQEDFEAADGLASGELVYIVDPVSHQPWLEPTDGLERGYYYPLSRQQPEIRHLLEHGKPRKRVVTEATVDVLVPRLLILAAAGGVFAPIEGFALVMGDTVLFQPYGASDQPLEPFLPYLSTALAAPGCVSHTSILTEPYPDYLAAFDEPPWSWVIHHEGETASVTDGFGRYLYTAKVDPSELPLPEACPALPTSMRLEP